MDQQDMCKTLLEDLNWDAFDHARYAPQLN